MEIPFEFIITSSTHNPQRNKTPYYLMKKKKSRYGFLVKIGGYGFLEKMGAVNGERNKKIQRFTESSYPYNSPPRHSRGAWILIDRCLVSRVVVT